MANFPTINAGEGTSVGTKSHAISLTAMSEKDFQDMFLALKTKGNEPGAMQNPDNYMANVPVKVWNGGFSMENGQFDETKVANDTVNLPINFAKMAGDLFQTKAQPKVVEADPLLPNKAPVMVTGLTDRATGDKKYAISIDPNALAAASAEEHFKASADKAATTDGFKAMTEKQLAASKQRFNVDMRLNTTDKSVAGISAQAIEANIGKVATQHYVFNPAFADVKDANGKVSKSAQPVADIKAATAKVADKYNGFILDKFGEAISSKKGLPEIKSATTGKAIPGTDIKAFPGSIKTVNEGGATRYVIQNDESKKKEVNDWFKSVNNRLSKEWAQEVFNTYGDDQVANKLASSIRPQMYSVQPQGSSAILVQPGMIASFAPYVNSFVQAYDAATHGRDIPAEGEKLADRSKRTEGNGKSVAEIYGEGKADFLKNAKDLYSTYTAQADALKDVENRKEILASLENVQFDGKGGPSVAD